MVGGSFGRRLVNLAVEQLIVPLERRTRSTRVNPHCDQVAATRKG